MQRSSFLAVYDPCEAATKFKIVNLALHFDISTSLVSRYFTTWICFLYHHLKEMDWIRSVLRVLYYLSLQKNIKACTV